MSTIAVIPARGGSKSIPRKNLLPLLGKPLIAWSILFAKKCPLISRVIVSTDDEEIASVALQYGAEVPFLRPSEFAQDDSTDLQVFQHLLNYFISSDELLPELLVHLRPTGPARSHQLIDTAINLISADVNATSLRSVSPSIYTPYKMWMNEGKYMKPVILHNHDTESHSFPRQKLPQTFWQNGYVDIIKPSTILKFNSMTGPACIPFLINNHIKDIDYLEDIPIVEQELISILNNDMPSTTPEIRHSV